MRKSLSRTVFFPTPILLLATLIVPLSSGQVVYELTFTRSDSPYFVFELDDAGTYVYASSAENPAAANSERQIFRWNAATGAAEQLSDFDHGVRGHVLVSDDGQWLLFLANGNPAGLDPDEGHGLYLMNVNGTGLVQLVDFPANAGTFYFDLSGNGQRVIFISDADLVAANPNHRTQLYVIERDGTGLRQLTNTTTAGYLSYPTISDDGQRITVAGNVDLVAQNADLSREVFAVNADGTGIRQLTNSSVGESDYPYISGNGSKITFHSQSDLTGGNPDGQLEVFVINWDGTGLAQLTDSRGQLPIIHMVSYYPSITDDGSVIWFVSNQRKGTTNTDGNLEIWKINSNGTGLTAVTNSTFSGGYYPSIVAGGGSRVAYVIVGGAPPGFTNPDLGYELGAMTSTGTGHRQLTNLIDASSFYGDLSPDGSRMVFASDADFLGSSPGAAGFDLFMADFAGGNLQQLTDIGDAKWPSIARDNKTIAFISTANVAGGNLDRNAEVMVVDTVANSLTQLTSGSGTGAEHVALSRNGAAIVFDSASNLTGGNADNSREIFGINRDGTGLRQLTSGPVNTVSSHPRIDSSGTWVVFQSSADLVTGSNTDGSDEIFRIRYDGTGLQQITSSTSSSEFPDISGPGTSIVFNSHADPVGANPEHNAEIFLYNTSGGVTTQLTSTVDVDSEYARISEDGAFVFFSSESAFYETGYDYDVLRVRVSTGSIERVNGLEDAYLYPPQGVVVTDADGDRAVVTASGDWTFQNRDYFPEVWAIDMTRPPAFHIGAASPTNLSWDINAGPKRYDVIRGDVTNLGPGGGGTIDLGPVTCVQDESLDNRASDAATPSPGQAFFFVYRGTQGVNAGPGSWGTGSNGAERQGGAGTCSP